MFKRHQHCFVEMLRFDYYKGHEFWWHIIRLNIGRKRPVRRLLALEMLRSKVNVFLYIYIYILRIKIFLNFFNARRVCLKFFSIYFVVN